MLTVLQTTHAAPTHTHIALTVLQVTHGLGCQGVANGLEVLSSEDAALLQPVWVLGLQRTRQDGQQVVHRQAACSRSAAGAAGGAVLNRSTAAEGSSNGGGAMQPFRASF